MNRKLRTSIRLVAAALSALAIIAVQTGTAFAGRTWP
jgi:hypothetical protein